MHFCGKVAPDYVSYAISKNIDEKVNFGSNTAKFFPRKEDAKPLEIPWPCAGNDEHQLQGAALSARASPLTLQEHSLLDTEHVKEVAKVDRYVVAEITHGQLHLIDKVLQLERLLVYLLAEKSLEKHYFKRATNLVAFVCIATSGDLNSAMETIQTFLEKHSHSLPLVYDMYRLGLFCVIICDDVGRAIGNSYIASQECVPLLSILQETLAERSAYQKIADDLQPRLRKLEKGKLHLHTENATLKERVVQMDAHRVQTENNLNQQLHAAQQALQAAQQALQAAQQASQQQLQAAQQASQQQLQAAQQASQQQLQAAQQASQQQLQAAQQASQQQLLLHRQWVGMLFGFVCALVAVLCFSR